MTNSLKNYLIIVMILVAFVYGFLAGFMKIFPFNEMRLLRNIIIGEAKISKEFTYHHKHKKSQFDLLSKNHKYTILMLGDSITADGEWNELLNSNTVLKRGVAGDTTEGIVDRLESINDGIKVAFIMAGINDIHNKVNIKETFENYKIIINYLKSRNIEPIVQSTLYTGKYKAYKYNIKVKELNSLLLPYANEKNITFIDLNKNFSPDNLLSEKYSLDGLHLNGEAYILWAKIIKKHINNL